MSNFKKINAAIVGLGNIGLYYDINNHKVLTHSKSIKNNNFLNLVAAFDLNKVNRNLFEKKYKIQTFVDFKNFDNFKKVELLVISSPTNTHFNIIRKIPKDNNLKYVILEKPGGKNLYEFKKILSFCKKKKILLFINYIREYLEDFSNLKNIIKKIKNKKIICWYSKGLVNNGSHMINFILSIFGWPKKITILNKYKKFSNDLDCDFKLEYPQTSIYFFCTPVKNISNNEIYLISQKMNLFSKNDFNNVLKSKIGSKKIELLAKTSNKLQSDVLNKIINNFKKKIEIDKFLKINLMTHKLIQYVQNKKNY